MNEYRIRIDGKSDGELRDFLRSRSERFLLVHHVTKTENPHYHAWVATKYTQGNFSNYIKKELNVSGSDYSNQKCDSNRRLEYFSYLFNVKKGNEPRYVFSEEVSELEIVQARENAKHIANEFAAKVASSKKTKYDVAMTVVEQGDTLNLEQIYDSVISVLKIHKMTTAPYVVRDIVATVITHSTNAKLKESLRDTVLNYFRI